jgi:hypothetical protein
VQYIVHREGGNLGPYSLADLRRAVAAGIIKAGDLAWHEGLSQWRPVSALLFISGVGQHAGKNDSPSTAAVENTRRRYFPHEQNIRSIGTYFCFAGVFQLIAGTVLLFFQIETFFSLRDVNLNVHLDPGHFAVTIAQQAFFFLAIGGLTIWTGRCFRDLNQSAYVAGIMVAVMGLLNIPIGTIASAVILYLIISDRTRFVLSDRYRQAIAATPQFQWKTVGWVKIIIALTLLEIPVVLAIFSWSSR